MKKKIFIAFCAVGVFICQTRAQESSTASNKTANWDLAKGKGTLAKVSPTENGVSINFTKIEYSVKSPRDAASGQASGKRQHKPFQFVVSSMDNTVSEIKSPRDIATGQSSGKVSYSDLSVMISPDKGSAVKIRPQKITIENGEFTIPPDLADGKYDLVLSWSWGESNSGSAKRCVTSFSVTMEDGVAMAISEQGIPTKKK